MPANWQLPPGVSRGLWEYLHDESLARSYDANLADCKLLEVDQVFVREHCSPPGSMVDLGCGTGRLAIALAREGYQVLAVDLSAEMLRVVGEKAERIGVHVNRLQANLVELECLADHSFDYAACLFSTLGMIAGQKERQTFLAHVYRLLRPGGKFVVHVHNRWFNFWTHAGRRLLVKDLVGAWLGRRVAGDYLMPPNQGIGSMPMHLFMRREIVRRLREAGFAILEVRPVSLREDGRLPWPAWFGWLRSYGYLVAAGKVKG